eukprot:PhF_6_TR30608/c0_g1_i2/m.45059
MSIHHRLQRVQFNISIVSECMRMGHGPTTLPHGPSTKPLSQTLILPSRKKSAAAIISDVAGLTDAITLSNPGDIHVTAISCVTVLSQWVIAASQANTLLSLLTTSLAGEGTSSPWWSLPGMREPLSRSVSDLAKLIPDSVAVFMGNWLGFESGALSQKNCEFVDDNSESYF